MNDQKVEEQVHINPNQLRGYTTGLLQGKAYSRLHTHLTRVLFPFNISIPEWKLLGQLHENGKVKLAVLAGLLSYDPPMVTKLVKQLEKKGLVKRTQDTIDERAKIITITSSGTKLIDDVEPEVKKVMRVLLNGITREELITYLKVLTVIVHNTTE
ncbi:MAG: MarR family transcriptional regulator [Candidatus Levybacteria bacterium]|nr:MarR family transcriptional regulator [Candidatus Levybacteria bacterium]